MTTLLERINQQRAKMQRGNNNRPEKLHSEKNLVRILPSWTGNMDDQNWQNWGQHFIKDQSGAIKAVYICSQTCFDEACPICEVIAQGAAMTSDEDTLKALKDARSSNRVLVNALYLKGGKHDNPESNPVVLDLPPSVMDGILATYQAYEEEGINVFDLDAGVNFIIEKTGTGMNTEYKVTPSPKSTKVDKAVMQRVKDLSEWARQESEADKNKAITSVRVISGMGTASTSVSARLPAPDRSANTDRLGRVEPDAVDVDFVDVGDTESIDDFLNDL